MGLLVTLHGHNIYAYAGSVAAGLTNDPAKIIAGTGSLRVTRGTGNYCYWNCVRTGEPYRFPNFYGSLRCKVMTEVPSSGCIGLYALASQEDVSGTSGSFYGCELFFNVSGSGTVRPRIAPYPSGIQTSPVSGLVNGTQVPYTLGTVYSLACQVWNGPEFGGILIHYWVAVGPDLPDTTQPPTLTGSFASSGVRPTFGEGEYGRINQFNGNAELIVDQVGRYPLLVDTPLAF